MLNTNLNLVLRLRISETILPFALYVFMAWTGTNLPFINHLVIHCSRKIAYLSVGKSVWNELESRKPMKNGQEFQRVMFLPVNIPAEGCSSGIIWSSSLAAESSKRRANVRRRISCAVRTTSNSRSRDCFISAAIMESIPSSANVECRLTVFRSWIPAQLKFSYESFSRRQW